MIIEAPYKAGDTVTIKTTAGEEILGRFVEENDKAVTVNKPMTLMQTQQGIGLGPFAFTVDPQSKIALNKSAVLFVHKTEKSMADQYIQSTSGLTVV